MAEKVGIELSLEYGDSLNNMRMFERELNGLNGKKFRVQLETNIKEKQKEIIAYQSAIAKLKKEQEGLDSKSDAYKSRSDQIKQYQNNIRTTTAEIKQMNNALKNTKSLSMGQVFSDWSSKIAHLGSAMQSAGNALTRISTPMRSLLRGTVFGAGMKLFSMMSEGLSGSLERADIMATYAPIMEALGVVDKDSTKAKEAVTALNDAVLGLPTGLDEIVEQHKLLTMALGDIDKAQELAIASNNAWLASGADDSAVTAAKKELQTLAQTGKLNERQWMTMQKGMSVTWNELEKKFRTAKESEESLLEMLKGGKVTAQEFMDALTLEGTKGKTKTVVGEMMHTYSAATANITNAFKRMGENVLGVLDEIFQAKYKKDTIDMIIGIKDVINQFSEGVQDWLRANPKVITDFIDTLSSFDWKSLATGIGEGLVWSLNRLADAMKLFSFLGTKGFGKFLGSSGFLGSFLTVVGGLLKGSRHIGGGVFAGAWKIIDHIQRKRVSEGKIGAFGKAIDKIKGIFTKTKDVAKEAETAGEVLSKGTTLKSFGSNLLNFLSPFLKIGGVIAIAWGSMKLMKGIVADMAEISQLATGVNWKTMAVMFGTLAGVVAGGGFLGKIPAMSGALVNAEVFFAELGVVVTTILGFAAIDTWLLKKTVQNIKNTLTAIKEAIDVADEIHVGTGTNARSKVKAAFDFLGDMSTYMNDNYVAFSSWTSFWDKWKSSNITQILRNIKESVSLINEIKTETDTINVNDEMALSKLMNTVGRIAQAAQSSLGEVKESKVSNARSVAQNLKGTITEVQNVANMIPDVNAVLAKITGGDNTILTDAKQNLEDFFNELTNVFQPMMNFSNRYSGSWIRNGVDLTEITTQLNSMKDVFSAIVGENGIVALIGQLNSQLPAILGYGNAATVTGGGESPLTKAMSMLSDMFGQINALYTELTDQGGFDSTKATTFSEIGTNLKYAISGIREAILQMQTIEHIKLGEGDGMFSAIEKIKNVISQLTEALGSDNLTSLKTKVDEFTTEVQSILDSIKSLGGENGEGIDLTIQINHTITGADETIADLKQARRDIIRAKDAIPSRLSRTIWITINGSITDNVTGKLRAKLAELRGLGVTPTVSVGERLPSANRSMGGYIRPLYRSKGGDVFKKRGTDTIPAMLTAGEYVHNRRAVKAFGMDFMNKVNRLDVDGAMKALQARVGAGAFGSRATTINNTVYNNQTYNNTQNVNTNSRGFAKLRNSRLVGAL